MKTGRKPTPSALNDLRGNPGKRARNHQEPRFPDGELRCPDWLGDAGRAKWAEMLPKLQAVPGLMKPAYGDALALYCEAFEDMLDAREEIAKEGATCTSDNGGAYQHPAVGRKNKAIQRMKAFGALFGLSPSDAANLKVMGGGDVEGEDAFTSLMRSYGTN